MAIVYGASGGMGGAVTRAFGIEGARLFLAGRTNSKVQAIADEVGSAGGWAQAAEVDVDDREAVERHAEDVLAAAGRIDVSFNAAGMNAVQNMPLVDMSVDDFMLPISEAARRHFITATAAARRMAPQGGGEGVAPPDGRLQCRLRFYRGAHPNPGRRTQGLRCACDVHPRQLHA